MTHAATELGTESVSSKTNSITSTDNSQADTSNKIQTNDVDTSLATPDPNSMRLLNQASNTTQINADTSVNELQNKDTSNAEFNGPSNLLVIYLQACSSALQETKMEMPNTYDRMKLFMQILVCISEDQYANSLLHDSNILYSVFLYQAVG